jgi:phosphoribosyl-ATP pyrophosphohydrolase/phosphoribosyl-AMP cyclohydrolase
MDERNLKEIVLTLDVTKINWTKVNGKIPAIIQDSEHFGFLMLGYQNQQALEKTLLEGKVTFYSRTKKRLWTKGETSGHFLNVVDVKLDCDGDALLYKVNPVGPTCHQGTSSCFRGDFDLFKLEDIIDQRGMSQNEKSYTLSLLKGDEDKLYRKVTEEATEVLLAAKNSDSENLKNEVADLFYHVLVTMKKQGLRLSDVYKELDRRHEAF